jgi:hypothetical protein
MSEAMDWGDRAKAAMVAAGAIALGVHFAITAAYVAPPSPLRLAMQPVFDAYVEPYFTQQWTLFAPAPAADLRSLLLSCRVRGDDAAIEETPFVDITAPLRELRQRYRLTPADRLARVHSGAIHVLFAAPEELEKKALDLPEDDAPDGVNRFRRDLKTAQKENRKVGERFLARIGSAECDRMYGAGRTAQVRFRMATQLPRPFSARNDPSLERRVEYVDFDWADYERVTPL